MEELLKWPLMAHQLATVVGAGRSHLSTRVYGPFSRDGPSPSTHSDLTTTGIACPVPKENSR